MFKTRSLWPALFLIIATGILFFPFLSRGLIPLPGDIVLGAYHPFKDVIWQGRVAGFPVKNFTIFDAIRQLYPWRWLAIEIIKDGSWPLWNSYQFTGTPLLAQIFTAVFYPLNFFFFIFNFKFAWGLLIFLQPILAGFFTYLFLRNLKLSQLAALMGATAFAFSSFLMMRLEWNIVGHTACWLPLALLAINKLKERIKLKWFFLFIFSLAFSFLGGYLQAVIYIYFLVFFYSFFRLWGERKRKIAIKAGLALGVGFVLSLFLVAIQTLPLLEVLRLSGRVNNPEAMVRFFLPWRHLIMFVAPDFFGNPATGNYWGASNYTEFCGYLGIGSLFLASLTLFGRQKREARFWQLIVLISFLFITSNPLTQFLLKIQLPVFSNLTPSRLIFPINFSLAILAALGVDWLERERSFSRLKKRLTLAVTVLVFAFVFIILIFLAGFLFWPRWQENALVSGRNLVLPFGLLLVNLFLISLFLRVRKKRWRQGVIFLFLVVLIFDLLRQAKKYNSFIEPQLIFPSTKTVKFLQRQEELFRFQKTDVELFPGNFQIAYGLEAIDGYDPFFSQRFARLASVGNGLGVENLGREFERDIFLGNHASPIFELLNTKYVLSLRDLSYQSHLKLIMEEGKTRLYENLRASPRAFLVDKVIVEPDEKQMLSLMLERGLSQEVILEKEISLSPEVDPAVDEEVVNLYYPSANKAVVEVAAPKEKILVLADSFYPGWEVLIDQEPREILRVNYNLRGVKVPAGEHRVDFIYDPRSFKIGLVLSLATLVFLIGGGIRSYFFRKEWW